MKNFGGIKTNLNYHQFVSSSSGRWGDIEKSRQMGRYREIKTDGEI
jgi:hypothetical protein